MKTKNFKSALLALASAATIVAASGASAAIPPPYLLCNFKGQTQLDAAGTSLGCWLNITAKVGCDSDTDTIYITSVGSTAGEASCGGLFLGNLPWTGSLAAILAGTGSIDTTVGSAGALPWSVIDGSMFTPAAGGVVTGVSGSAGPAQMCNGKSITIPSSVTVTGTTNFGPMLGSYATFNTKPSLANLGCHVVP